jgi:adenosylcobinamide-GDP ribazoletransferase
MARRRLWPAWLQDLAGAWVFYSVLPGWPGSSPRFMRIARFAPWIGLVLGGLEGLLWLLTAGWLPQPVQVCLVIALGLILSGGLHLDGVIDTADGLAAGPRALEAMDDSRAGAAGVQALVLLLLLRAAGLLALAALAPPLLVAWTLVLTAIWGRISPLVAIARFPYLRDGGTAGFHRQGQRGLGRELLPALLLLVALALLAWLLPAPADRATPLPALLLAWLLPALPAVAVPLWLGRRLGGHSGDSYGACVEWSQTVGLLLCALVLSAPPLREGLMAAG